MSDLYSVQFWKQAFERGIRAGAWATATVLGLDQVGPVADVFSVSAQVLGQSFVSGLVCSVLFSVAASPIAVKGTPSLVRGAGPEPVVTMWAE